MRTDLAILDAGQLIVGGWHVTARQQSFHARGALRGLGRSSSISRLICHPCLHLAAEPKKGKKVDPTKLLVADPAKVPEESSAEMSEVGTLTVLCQNSV